MNKLYLLFIIFMIILFYLYINNISIEFFDTIPKLDGLPAADLGPIQFVDSQGVELGRYPLYSDRDPSLQDTVITINDGSRGDPGPPATTQQPAVCYGDVNLRTITGNQLDVFTDKLNLIEKSISALNNHFDELKGPRLRSLEKPMDKINSLELGNNIENLPK